VNSTDLTGKGCLMKRCGKPPYLECSVNGDKRFSMYHATITTPHGIKTIAEIYNASKKFNSTSGLLNADSIPINRNELYILHEHLWDQYLKENINLILVLINASGLSDEFAQDNLPEIDSFPDTATTLWRLRNKFLK